MLVSGRETTPDIGSNRFKQVKEINFAQLSDLGVVFVGWTWEGEVHEKKAPGNITII